MPGSLSVTHRARGALVRVSVAAVVALIAISCAGEGSADGTVRDDRGAIIAAGRVAALELQVGDCFDTAAADDDDPATVHAVPCTTTHDSEVVGLVTLTGDAFPGDVVVDRTAQARCIDVFEGYVGTHFLVSELELRYLAPNERTWDGDDDRDVACIAHLGGGRLAESVRRSGR